MVFIFVALNVLKQFGEVYIPSDNSNLAANNPKLNPTQTMLFCLKLVKLL